MLIQSIGFEDDHHIRTEWDDLTGKGYECFALQKAEEGHMMHGAGIEGAALNMPAIVGADGVESDIPINLNGEEALKLKESADSLKKIVDTLGL